MPVRFAFHEETEEEGEEMKAKNKAQHYKEHLSDISQRCVLFVLFYKVDQTQKQEQLENLTKVKMYPQMSLLKGLNVHRHTDKCHLQNWKGLNGVLGLFIVSNNNNRKEYFFGGWPEEKVLAHGFVVGPQEVEDCSVGVVLHPFGLDQLLSALVDEPGEGKYLKRKKHDAHDWTKPSKSAHKRQVFHLCENVYVQLD